METRLLNRMDKFDQKLDDLAANFDKKLDDQAAKFDKKLDDQAAKFDKRLDDQDGRLKEHTTGLHQLRLEIHNDRLNHQLSAMDKRVGV